MNGNRIFALFLPVCCLLCVCFVTIPSPVLGDVGDITISTPATNPSPGSTFTSVVSADVGNQVIGSYDMRLNFNKDVLQIQTVGGGAPELGLPVVNIQNPNGSLLVNGTNGANFTEPTGIVNLFSVTFQVIGTGGTTSTLHIGVNDLLDVNFSNIFAKAIDSQVTVASAPTIVSFTADPPSITAGQNATLA